jgi:hypothetical protein
MCVELRVGVLCVCVCGDTILAEVVVVVVCVLFVLYTCLKIAIIGGRNM